MRGVELIFLACCVAAGLVSGTPVVQSFFPPVVITDVSGLPVTMIGSDLVVNKGDFALVQVAVTDGPTLTVPATVINESFVLFSCPALAGFSASLSLSLNNGSSYIGTPSNLLIGPMPIVIKATSIQVHPPIFKPECSCGSGSPLSSSSSSSSSPSSSLSSSTFPVCTPTTKVPSSVPAAASVREGDGGVDKVAVNPEPLILETYVVLANATEPLYSFVDVCTSVKGPYHRDSLCLPMETSSYFPVGYVDGTSQFFIWTSYSRGAYNSSYLSNPVYAPRLTWAETVPSLILLSSPANIPLTFSVEGVDFPPDFYVNVEVTQMGHTAFGSGVNMVSTDNGTRATGALYLLGSEYSYLGYPPYNVNMYFPNANFPTVTFPAVGPPDVDFVFPTVVPLTGATLVIGGEGFSPFVNVTALLVPLQHGYNQMEGRLMQARYVSESLMLLEIPSAVDYWTLANVVPRFELLLAAGNYESAASFTDRYMGPFYLEYNLIMAESCYGENSPSITVPHHHSGNDDDHKGLRTSLWIGVVLGLTLVGCGLCTAIGSDRVGWGKKAKGK